MSTDQSRSERLHLSRWVPIAAMILLIDRAGCLHQLAATRPFFPASR